MSHSKNWYMVYLMTVNVFDRVLSNRISVNNEVDGVWK